MRFTEKEKGLIVSILYTIYKNIKNGENAEDLTTDISLIFRFSDENFIELEKLIKRAAREYYL